MLNIQLKKTIKETIDATVLKVAWINDIYKLYFPLLLNRNKNPVPLSESQSSQPKQGYFISADELIQTSKKFWRIYSFQTTSPGGNKTREYLLFDRFVFPFTQFRGGLEELVGHSQKYFPPKRFLTSWNGASALCRSNEAYLPYFYSREELEEFIAILKLSNSVPPLEGIYIGIKTDNKNKVSNFCLDSQIHNNSNYTKKLIGG